MTLQTQTTDGAQQSFPTAEELYDTIMQQVEPELMRANLPTLDDPYQGESDVERKKRYERYSEAFAEFEKRKDTYMTKRREDLDEYYKNRMEQIEAASQKKDAAVLARLEANFL